MIASFSRPAYPADAVHEAAASHHEDQQCRAATLHDCPDHRPTLHLHQCPTLGAQDSRGNAPWKPSTESISTAARDAGRSSLSSATCPLYGVMMPTSTGRTPAAIKRARCAMTTCAAGTHLPCPGGLTQCLIRICGSMWHHVLPCAAQAWLLGCLGLENRPSVSVRRAAEQHFSDLHISYSGPPRLHPGSRRWCHPPP